MHVPPKQGGQASAIEAALARARAFAKDAGVSVPGAVVLAGDLNFRLDGEKPTTVQRLVPRAQGPK